MFTLRKFAVAATLASSLFSAAALAVCADCGVVQSVETVKQEGQGSGLGAVAGGLVGGLVGNQVGKGTGNTIATIAGAAGGAYAGNQIEKKTKSKNVYKVHVKMESGSEREFTFDEAPAFAAGDKVKVDNDQLVKAPAVTSTKKKHK
jgi:outer membrane lipoprotein SlyB